MKALPIFLSFLGLALSQNQPAFVIKGWNRMEYLEDNPNIVYRDNNRTILASERQVYRINCNAKYLVRLRMNFEGERSELGLVRFAGNVLDLSTYSFNTYYHFQTGPGVSGSVTCFSVDDPKLSSSVHIFTEVGNAFVNNGETIEVSLKENCTLPQYVPCPANYHDLEPVLMQRRSTKERVINRKWKYDPKHGFSIEGQSAKSLLGEFYCLAPNNDTVTIKFVQEGSSEPGTSVTQPEFWLPAATTRIVCFGAQPNGTKFLDIRCDYPDECELHRKCFHSQTCPAPRIEADDCDNSNCKNIAQAHTNGLVFCESGNASINELHFTGYDRKIYFTTQEDIPQRALILMDEVDPILYTDQPVLFFCQALQFFFTNNIQFSVVYRNGTETELPEGSFTDISEEYEDERLSLGSIQKGVWMNLTEDMRQIICRAPWYNSSTAWYTKSRSFQVQAARSPLGLVRNSASEHVFYVGDEGRHISCSSPVFPYPQFMWLRNGTEIPTDNRTAFSVSTVDGESTLKFPKLDRSFSGDYDCIVSNRLGNDTKRISVDVRDSRLSSSAIGGIAVLVLLMAVIVGVVFYRLQRKYLIAKEKLRNLTKQEVYDFVRGNPEALSSGGDVQENAQFLPFNRSYEISDEHLLIDKGNVLGKGAFGMVLKGKFMGEPVAVKTTLPNADIMYFKALLAELKVMAYIGSHPNVVRFIGAVTQNIQERVVYVVVELSPLGNLESYLKSHRTTYVNCIIGEKILKAELTYENMYKKVNTFDFVKWCSQIASGMEYLASRKVVHADLATRNVLLFEDEVAKITDFGLSRQVYENTNYVKKNQAPLPWRWMAIESLRDLEFSAQSDVWAFGVTAWEIFTMAELPYPGLSWSLNFVEQLSWGMRMPKPKFATKEIYNMLLKCWEPEPSSRPTFSQLREFFQEILASSDFQPESTSINIDKALYSNYCG